MLPQLAAAGVVVPPRRSVVEPDGITLTLATTPDTFAPDTDPRTFPVYRAGFDASGNRTAYLDTFTRTIRKRLPYPASTVGGGNSRQFTFTPDKAIADDYIYRSDTPVGFVNNSAEVCPQPVVNWCMPARQTVGNTLNLELVAFHRNARLGREVACVKFIATDGTTTVSQVVSATTVSGRTGDQHAVIVYACALDITTLTNNVLITANAEVYPWIGDDAAVNKSANNTVALSGGTVEREFSPCYFLKNTSLAASPNIVVVKAGGSDTTGVVSTSEATAFATPCLTIVGALKKLTASGRVDGGEIRVTGQFDFGDPIAAQVQNIACVTITRYSGTARAAAICNFPNANFRPRLTSGLNAATPAGCVRMHDVSIKRTGSLGAFGGEAGNNLLIILDDVDFDIGGLGGSYLSTASDEIYGCNFANYDNTTSILGASTGEHRIIRGVSVNTPTNPAGIEGYLMLGCTIGNPAGVTVVGGTRNNTGAILAFNRFNSPTSTTLITLAASQGVTVKGCAVVQNVIEDQRGDLAGNNALIFSGDAALDSVEHAISHHNTIVGIWVNARSNQHYTDGTSNTRYSKLSSEIGNIYPMIQTKSDIFVALNGGDPTHAPLRFPNNLADVNGVGHKDNLYMFDGYTGVVGPQSYPEYVGLHTQQSPIGSDPHIRNPDPLFTDYEAGIWNGSAYAAGTGGGTYTVSNISPCKAGVRVGILSHDFAGNARSLTNDTIGAYA